MDPKLQSLPPFIRAEPSPKVMDSAFPPFKVEHRYRGVYERAGFDVNLGGNGPHRDNESRYSSKSSHFPHRSINSPGSSSQPSPTSATSKQFSISSKKPYFSSQRQHQYQQQHQQNRTISEHATPPRAMINSNLNSSTRSFSDTSSTQPNTNRSTDLFTNSAVALHQPTQGHDTTLTSPPSSPDSPNLTDNIHGRKPPPRDSFNFSPEPNQLPQSPQQHHHATNPKNVKNLQLNLGEHSNSNFDVHANNSYDTSHSTTDNPAPSFDDYDLHVNDTKDTSFDHPSGASSSFQFQNQHQQSPAAPTNGAPYPEQENLSTSSIDAPIPGNQQQVLAPPASHDDPNAQPRLSTLLDDFRKDIEDHKNYTPKSPTNSTQIPASAQSPPLPAMSPTQLGLTRFSPSSNNHATGNDQVTDDNANDDYQRFLQGKLSPVNQGKAANRTSQLSTVSSVISKSSNYDDDDDDDEIEKELQRQLETLKASGNSTVEIQPEVESFDERSMLSAVSQHNNVGSHQRGYSEAGAPEPPMPDTTAEAAPAVPTFTIDDAETTEAKAKAQAAKDTSNSRSMVSEEPDNEDDSDFNDLSSHASFESVQPLSVRHSRIKPLTDEQLKHLQHSEIDHPLPASTQIPPLHPHHEPGPNHEVNLAETAINTPEANQHNDEAIPEANYPLHAPSQVSEIIPPPPVPSDHLSGSLPYPMQEYHEQQQDVTPEMPCTDEFARGHTPHSSNNSSAPLSPHMMKVQEELSQMNFNMNINTQSPSNSTDDMPESPGSDAYDEEIQPLNTKSIDAVLASAQQGPPQTKPSHQRAAKDDEAPQKVQPIKYPPGEGPCRICHQDISPTATGSKKSIYSRTGELSGQWHRSCFTCAYDASCSVKFNKSVQCYAWHDDAYCHQHYHELNGTLCRHCQSGIEGECIENELQQKWHLNCLKCEKCFENINVDYYLINNHIYCEQDAMNIINGRGSYNGLDGNLRSGGLSTADKIEKRRTRVLFVE